MVPKVTPPKGFPLSEELQRQPGQPGFELPQLPVYSGGEDPERHLQHFVAMALLHGWNEVTRCRVFPLSLAGQAQRWFTELPAGHIRSFEQLRKEFLNAFSVYLPKKKSAIYLMSLQQKPNESLKQYIERFKTATQEVRDLPVGLAASALLNGTTYAPLRRSLAFSEPNSMTELFDRVEQFIVQMEILDAGEGSRRGKEIQPELRRTLQNSENARPQRVYTTDSMRWGDGKSLEQHAPQEILLNFTPEEGDEARDAESSLSPEVLLDPTDPTRERHYL